MGYFYNIGDPAPDCSRVVAIGHVLADFDYPADYGEIYCLAAGSEIMATTTLEDSVYAVWCIDDEGYPYQLFDISVYDFADRDPEIFAWDEWDESSF